MTVAACADCAAKHTLLNSQVKRIGRHTDGGAITPVWIDRDMPAGTSRRMTALFWRVKVLVVDVYFQLFQDHIARSGRLASDPNVHAVFADTTRLQINREI